MSNQQTHLLIDGYKCNHKKLDDMEFWYDLIHNKIPKLLDMKVCGFPKIIRFVDKNYTYIDKLSGKKISHIRNPDLDGLTGFQIIATSHISFHTWVNTGVLKMDIFSCRYFNTERIKEFIKKEIDIKLLNFRIVDRGDEI